MTVNNENKKNILIVQDQWKIGAKRLLEKTP